MCTSRQNLPTKANIVSLIKCVCVRVYVCVRYEISYNNWVCHDWSPQKSSVRHTSPLDPYHSSIGIQESFTFVIMCVKRNSWRCWLLAVCGTSGRRLEHGSGASNKFRYEGCSISTLKLLIWFKYKLYYLVKKKSRYFGFRIFSYNHLKSALLIFLVKGPDGGFKEYEGLPCISIVLIRV